MIISLSLTIILNAFFINSLTIVTIVKLIHIYLFLNKIHSFNENCFSIKIVLVLDYYAFLLLLSENYNLFNINVNDSRGQNFVHMTHV